MEMHINFNFWGMGLYKLLKESFSIVTGLLSAGQNVALLEQEEDVNQLTEFFSYEHFYVIYCKFWELDTDHDLYIDQKDLAGHNDQGAQTHPCLF